MIENEQLSMFSEGEPKPRKEKMKVSKVVLIVVALHVLVIGGFLLFEAFNREAAPVTAMASNESLPGDPQATATDPHAATAGTQTTPSLDGLTPVAPNLLPSPDQAAPAGAAPTALAPVTAPEMAAAPAPAPAARTYTVKKGDSLWKIAKAEGVSMTDLAQANSLTKTSVLKIGQQLQLPAATTANSVNIATGAVAPSPAAPAISGDVAASPDLYVVKSGDSLWKIAKSNGSTVKAIKEANQMSGDSLKVGQKLRVPASSPVVAASAATAPAARTAPAVNGAWNMNSFYEPGRHDQGGQVIHAVDNGETIDIIARNYGVRASDIIQANPKANPTKLYYGQPLVIPQAAPAATLPTAVGEPSAMLTTPVN
jgi:LysM repeat protein